MTSHYFDEQKLREIAERVDLVELVAESIRLTRKGGRYWGLCPFHQEKTPSFSVNREKNVFYCFGCHKGGNAYTFLMQKEGMSFREAALALAERAGIELVAEETNQLARDQRREMLDMNRLAADYYTERLLGNAGDSARNYLQKRGIVKGSIEKFALGYAGHEGDGLVSHLQKKGYSASAIVGNGLARVHEKSGRCYDLFRDRIVFPIARYDGGIMAFGGRTMVDATPKYLNSPESDIYSKRRHLYGLMQAREQMRATNQAILVEGYMDCIKMHQAGVANTVASLGTAFTVEQAELIARYAESVLVVYDGDEAGQRETMRAIEILENQGLGCHVLVLPAGKDPDDLVSQMKAGELGHYIANNQVSGIEFRINRLVENIRGEGIEEKLKVIREIKPRIQSLESTLEREHYSRIISRKLRMEERAVLREMADARRDGLRRQQEQVQTSYIPDLAERVVATAIHRPVLHMRLVESLGTRILQGSPYGDILAAWDQLVKSGHAGAEAIQAMEELMEQKGLQNEFARLLILNEDQYLNEEELGELIGRLRARREEKAWEMVFRKVDRLGENGDFAGFIGIILDFHRIINYNQEGETD